MLFKKRAEEKEVAVIGAFRSGTNYLRALLETNYHCRAVYHAYGWKHGFIPVLSSQSAFTIKPMPGVFVTKAPMAFLDSLFRYRNEVERNLASPKEWHAFLRSPLTIFVQRRGEGPEYRFPTPVDYWNALNWNYLSAARLKNGIHHVRYEDALTTPEQETARLASALGLSRRRGPFQSPERLVRRMSDVPRTARDYESDASFDPAFYTEMRFMERYDQDDVAFVRGHLDPELLAGLRYAPSGDRVAA